MGVGDAERLGLRVDLSSANPCGEDGDPGQLLFFCGNQGDRREIKLKPGDAQVVVGLSPSSAVPPPEDHR